MYVVLTGPADTAAVLLHDTVHVLPGATLRHAAALYRADTDNGEQIGPGVAVGEGAGYESR